MEQCQAPCKASLTFWGLPTRPLLGFTFAINYALGGLEVLGYHVFNVAIHLTNALLLFGILVLLYRYLPRRRAPYPLRATSAPTWCGTACSPPARLPG